MNLSKLKTLLIAACCFVIALCSEVKCMDTESDIHRAASYKNNHGENYLDNLKQESAPDTLLFLTQDENKSSKASWKSYVASPIQSIIYWTYNVADFAVKHPTQAMITSLIVAAQLTVVAADCNCILYTGDTKPYNGNPLSYGQFPNETACQSLANKFQGYSYYGCV